GGGAINRRNFIDEYLFGAMDADGIPHSDLCTDSEFLRRAYLDLTGKIPPVEEVRAFLKDPNPNKRAERVEELLATEDFTDRWVMWFGDYFQNTIGQAALSPAGQAGRILAGREVYNAYFRSFVATDRPYNEMAQGLIDAATRAVTTSAEGATANF